METTLTKKKGRGRPKTIAGFEKDSIVNRMLKKFSEDGFTYESFIPHEWFFETAGMERPYGSDMSFEEAAGVQMKFMGIFGDFRFALLKQRKMDLVNHRGKGYEVIHPSQQSVVAFQDFLRTIAKAQENASIRMRYVNEELMSMEQRHTHHDAIARLGVMSSMIDYGMRQAGVFGKAQEMMGNGGVDESVNGE